LTVFAGGVAAAVLTSARVGSPGNGRSKGRIEGHTHNGHAAIKKWKADASAKYQYTCEPFACEEKDGKFVVTSRLTGNFPGSPVSLRFFFELEGDKIASLEVIP
jgi:hypothetical protein